MLTVKSFRNFLLVFLTLLTLYTGAVGLQEGWNLIPLFFQAMVDLNWQGQFNLDFSGFLALSAIWVAWRNQFSPAAWGLAVLAFFGGMMFLSIYLLFLLHQTQGSVIRLLCGSRV